MVAGVDRFARSISMRRSYPPKNTVSGALRRGGALGGIRIDRFGKRLGDLAELIVIHDTGRVQTCPTLI